ncbi:hypothetical protein ACLQ22_22935 [Micromonospora sp. DT178]
MTNLDVERQHRPSDDTHRPYAAIAAVMGERHPPFPSMDTP